MLQKDFYPEHCEECIAGILARVLGFKIGRITKDAGENIPHISYEYEKPRGWPKGVSREEMKKRKAAAAPTQMRQSIKDPDAMPPQLPSILSWSVILKNKQTQENKSFMMDGITEKEIADAIMDAFGRDYMIVSIAPEIDTARER